MEGDLMSLAAEVLSAVNDIQEHNFGSVTESNFQIKMNDIDEESGIGIKAQIVLNGPTLDKMKENGSELFPGKSNDDFFVILSIKTKGDPQETVDEVQGIIEAYGLPMDMVSQFAEVKFHAGDGEVLIGFKAAENPYTDMAKSFSIKPEVFGDGSQDISIDLSLNLGTSFSDMLDDAPFFTHLLKAGSIHLRSTMHEKTRENILRVLADKKEQLDPLISLAPFLAPILLFKKLDGVIELQCTDEMVEKLKNTAMNANPMAVMSLKEIFSMVKMMGIPIDMFMPIFDLISNKTGGELSISGVTSAAWKVTFRLPGLDQTVAAFLSD